MNFLPEFLLLDLDDTILEASRDIEVMWDRACALADEAGGPVDGAVLRAAVGRSKDHFWSDADRHREGRLDLIAARRRIVADALAALGVEAPEFGVRVADHYTALRDDDIRPLPGAIDAVVEFRRRGHRLGLLTNGASGGQRAKIERFRLEPLFDHIFIEGEQGVGKPEPEAFLNALRVLGGTPAEAAMVGDNYQWEVVAPVRLGMTAIWVDHRRRGVPPDAPEKPHRVVERLAELVDTEEA